MTIYQYLQERNPEASKSLSNGAVNCILKKYGDVGYDAGKFFDLFAKKSDEELLTIRNMGINKVRFLRQALKLPFTKRTRETTWVTTGLISSTRNLSGRRGFPCLQKINTNTKQI